MRFYKKYKPLLNLSNSEYSIIAATGGRLSGKTTHAGQGTLTACLESPKRVCCFRETKDTVNDSIKAELEMIIERDFPDCGFESTSTEIRHPNGSVIFFKGLKEVNIQAIEALKGVASSTDIFLIDEAQAVTSPVWRVLIPTLRKQGCVLIVLYNRISDELPVEEALFLDYETMTAPKNTYFIEVNYPEIEHLGFISEQAIERANIMKANKPDEYMEIYLNKVKPRAENAVVKYFSDENICGDMNYCDDLPLYYGFDFNIGSQASCLYHCNNKRDKFYFIDEFCIENVNTQTVINEVIRRYPNHKNKWILTGDASGRSRKTSSDYSDIAIIYNTLVEHGYEVEIEIPRANPPIINRINAFNEAVYGTDGQRRVIIHPKCKEIIKAMKQLQFKKGTQIIDCPTPRQLETDTRFLFTPHIFDAVSYGVAHFNPIEFV